MPRFIHLSVLILLLSLVVGVQADDPPAIVIPLETPPEYQQLLTNAQTFGSVRVIVGLNVPFQPEGNLSGGAATVQQQRINIQQAQRQLLAVLPSAENIRPFRYIPYIALSVDQQGLLTLMSSNLVASITPDEALTFFLEQSLPLIGAPAAWASGYEGAGEVIAVLDSGVDVAHPQFSGRVASEACFSETVTLNGTNYESVCPGGADEVVDQAGSAVPCGPSTDCGHGTHVAGIASAVAPEADVLAVQVASSPSGCDGFLVPCAVPLRSNVLAGLEYVYEKALDGMNVTVVNLSLGSVQTFNQCDPIDPPQKALVDTLASVDVAVVAGTGNSRVTNGISFPACLSNTISVGSTRDDDSVSLDFSNSTGILDLLAPGSDINAAFPGGGTQVLSGTSMATPHVAGAWAVLAGASPSATNDDILTALQEAGVPITDPANGIIAARIQVDNAVTTLLDGVPARDDVLINEIQVEGTQAIELYNAGAASADLTGWTLTLYATSGMVETVYTLPNGFTLPANGYVVLYRGTGTDTDTALYMGDYTTTWASTASGAARLSNGSVGIDFARWGSLTLDAGIGTGWTGSNPPGPPAGSNIGRDDLSTDIDDASDFSTMPATLGAVNQVVRPPNDDFANAADITALPYTIGINTRNATDETDEPDPGCAPSIGRSVWFSYTAPEDAVVSFQTIGSDFDTAMAVYTGTSLTTLTEVDCNEDIVLGTLPQSRITLAVTTGQTYYIQVGGLGGFGGGLNFAAIAAPDNDDFDRATEITTLPYNDTMDIALTTVADDDPPMPAACVENLFGVNSYLSTVWYRYTATGDAQINLNTQGTDYDTVIAVYTGERGNLSLVGCDDEITLLSGTSDLTINVTAGTTYHILVGELEDLIAGVLGTPPGTSLVLNASVVGGNVAPNAQPDEYEVISGTLLDVAAPGVLDNDTDSDPLTAVLVDNPQHATTFTLSSDGAFSYQSEAGFTGVDTFTYRADDGAAQSGVTTVSIAVTAPGSDNQPPQVTTPGDQFNQEGDTVTLQIDASDPDGDPLTYEASNLPDGLSIDSSGLIGGTVATGTAGDYTVTVTVSDDGTPALSSSATFNWNVTTLSSENRPPQITTALPDRRDSVGESISLQIEATDPDGDALTFAASGLPNGLSISSSGLISGIPTTIDTFTVTIIVSDGVLQTTDSFNWVITGAPLPGNTPPQFDVLPGEQGTLVNTAASLQLQASDPDGDPLTFGEDNLPDGLMLDSSTGLISGTPVVSGIYTVTVTVTDGNSDPVAATFDWLVVPDELALMAPTGTVTETLGNPTYIWSDRGAAQYGLYIALGSDIFASRFFDPVDAATACDGLVCRFDPTTVSGAAWLSDGDYQVWLQGAGDWVGPFTFNIDAPPVGTPTPLEPLTDTSRPTLQWRLDGDAANAAWFQVYFGRAGDPLPAVFTWTPRSEVCNGVDCALRTPVDIVNGTYSLYLRGWGPDGMSAWAGPLTYTQSEPRPDTIDGMQVTTAPLTLTWDAEPGAAWYQVWIGTLEPASSVYFEWLYGEDIGCTTTCSITPSVPGGTYTWAVRAWGSGGMSDSWTIGPEIVSD